MEFKKVASIIDSIDLKLGGMAHSVRDIAISNSLNNIQHDIVHLGKKTQSKIQGKIKFINLDQRFLKYALSFKLIYWLLENKEKYDLFIIHGIWQFQTLCARLIIPGKYIVFTHGMLDPYFGTEFIKSIKKKIYWYFIEKNNLLKSKNVIANSTVEINHLKKTFLNTSKLKIKKVNYGIIPKKINFEKCKKKFLNKYKYLKNKKTILYVGRIHPKKGCDILIKAFQEINPYNVSLLIAGPTENMYAKKIINYVKKNHLEKKIYFLNFIKNEIKWGAIYNAECSILPSHGENFGVSVVESLYAKTPIICTNKVGVYKEIKKYKCGLVINNTQSSIKKGLLKFLRLDQNSKKKMNKNTTQCFNNNFNLASNSYFSDWIKNTNFK